MIKSKADLHLYLNEDAKANGINSVTDYYVKLFYGNIGACVVRYLKALRYYEYSLNTNKLSKFWYRYKLRTLGNKYNITIIPNTTGYGICIPHFEGGIVLNCKHLGNHCILGFGILVGNKTSQSNLATIGDNVKLDAGCKVIGAVTIGDNVEVAPNAVVVKDVPENSIVGGVPAKILKMKVYA